MQQHKEIVILLCGGDNSTRDIKRALELVASLQD
jgi:putative component of toxin-antitoxin plasmid stabilization module